MHRMRLNLKPAGAFADVNDVRSGVIATSEGHVYTVMEIREMFAEQCNF